MQLKRGNEGLTQALEMKERELDELRLESETVAAKHDSKDHQDCEHEVKFNELKDLVEDRDKVLLELEEALIAVQVHNEEQQTTIVRLSEELEATYIAKRDYGA